MKVTGFVHKYGDNIDTDVIIPARHLNTSDHKTLASHCMEDIDASFVSNVKAGDIMVGGLNFGCGSSREHAPIAIKKSGISCVIASTFARIFYRNAINIGLSILECPEASKKIGAGDEVSVDFNTGIIANLTKQETYQAVPFPEFIKDIIHRGGLLSADSDNSTSTKSFSSNELSLTPSPTPAHTPACILKDKTNPVDIKRKKITIISGDGIGPEVIAEAVKILNKISSKYNHNFEYQTALAGGIAIDQTGQCLPDETIALCKASDAVLLGAVGGFKWDSLPVDQRPEKALLRLRKELGLFANLRPAILFDELSGSCPLKSETVEGGIDIMVVRELMGGIYFGEKGIKNVGQQRGAYDMEFYTEEEIKRIAKVAFNAAMERNKKVTSIDKANVLESSRLWRKVVSEVAENYPDVTLDNLYIDNAAMQLIKNPKQFDVIVTNNIFGDILSDEASMITGSIGMLPSASLSYGNFGMYEPIHGSAPDIAGQDKANPIATILSVAMMLKYTFNLVKEADEIEAAVKAVLAEGYRTGDIMSEGCKFVGTKEMGDLISSQL